ncbi:MAG: SEC-C domain-containing protein [Deltaproteobacteria bacterium]|nr:SEC-C domain-containing protein [Deltaproteobacteria bacterium]
MIDSENRLRVGGFKKTAKLGTETNPAVVHVRTEARLKEVSALFNERGWKYKVGLEPDKPEDITALERLLNPPKPKRVEKRLGRNEPCSCGSGKKYKICCGE